METAYVLKILLLLIKLIVFIYNKTKKINNKRYEIDNSRITAPYSNGIAGKQIEKPHKRFLKHCRKEE